MLSKKNLAVNPSKTMKTVFLPYLIHKRQIGGQAVLISSDFLLFHHPIPSKRAVCYWMAIRYIASFNYFHHGSFSCSFQLFSVTNVTKSSQKPRTATASRAVFKSRPQGRSEVKFRLGCRTGLHIFLSYRIWESGFLNFWLS